VTTFKTTTTKIIPTATVTSTAIFTRDGKASANSPSIPTNSTNAALLPVCGPENNYGFVYNSVEIYTNNPLLAECNPPAVPRSCYPLILYPEPANDHHDCCAACYSLAGCYSYRMDFSDNGGVCSRVILYTTADPPNEALLNIAGNITKAPPSRFCPNGNMWVTETTPGNSMGVGPCAHGWLKDAY
jgi:hypothetical protein